MQIAWDKLAKARKDVLSDWATSGLLHQWTVYYFLDKPPTYRAKKNANWKIQTNTRNPNWTLHSSVLLPALPNNSTLFFQFSDFDVKNAIIGVFTCKSTLLCVWPAYGTWGHVTVLNPHSLDYRTPKVENGKAGYTIPTDFHTTVYFDGFFDQNMMNYPSSCVQHFNIVTIHGRIDGCAADEDNNSLCVARSQSNLYAMNLMQIFMPYLFSQNFLTEREYPNARKDFNNRHIVYYGPPVQQHNFRAHVAPVIAPSKRLAILDATQSQHAGMQAPKARPKAKPRVQGKKSAAQKPAKKAGEGGKGGKGGRAGSKSK